MITWISDSKMTTLRKENWFLIHKTEIPLFKIRRVRSQAAGLCPRNTKCVWGRNGQKDVLLSTAQQGPGPRSLALVSVTKITNKG
jgi:hypothetical protein